MKISTFFLVTALASATNVAAQNGLINLINAIVDAVNWKKDSSNGISNYLQKLDKGHPSLMRTPIVLSCDRSEIVGVNWNRKRVRVWLKVNEYRDCDLTICDPDHGSCKFTLKGDGGYNNWRYQNWNREGKSKTICYPKKCSQMRRRWEALPAPTVNATETPEEDEGPVEYFPFSDPLLLEAVSVESPDEA
ncbi:hypothetical protein TWF694_005851 [Orbilia ellipsospora]|uniref:Uncharacterized protein n=1 Tax=Orbilia ellipsospora TaxID=2528407 RepID=A0AAV9WS60_9PEZI